jgi:hypothetical protein
MAFAGKKSEAQTQLALPPILGLWLADNSEFSRQPLYS